MEEALTARALADTPLQALIADRFTWGERVQGEPLPAITAMTVSPGRFYLHSGADSIGNPRVQFDCYGKTAAEALAVAKALLTMLETKAVVGDVAFSVSLLDAMRGPLVEDLGGGRKVHSYSLDFFIWFSPVA
jgi:Protein of unknown function (DUF3168)